jgi:hypothetical protein
MHYIYIEAVARRMYVYVFVALAEIARLEKLQDEWMENLLKKNEQDICGIIHLIL